MSEYKTLYVEGSNDEKALRLMFPIILGDVEIANSKTNVRKMVSQTPNCFGIIDCDFEFEAEEEPNIAKLDRYSLENYLLEPAYLFELAQELKISNSAAWSSEESIREILLKSGQSCCHYATANKLLYEFDARVHDESLMKYFKEQPGSKEAEEVLKNLIQRFAALPNEAEIRTLWTERFQQVSNACKTLEGIHRWIDGKVLLRQGIYLEIRKVYRKNLPVKYMVENLAKIASKEPPQYVADTLRRIGLLE